jgi:cobalt-zinc-cadmium resistance protein CzcA
VGPVERLVAAALRQRLFVLLCLAALVATGIAAWRELPVEAFPDLTNNQVVVVTTADGLAAPEVEQRVTFPIETALMGTPGAAEVRSISKFGLSIVTIVFEDRVPVYFARQLVSERLADVRGRLPLGAEPTLGPVATAFGEIYQYLVEGDTADAMAKKTLHDWDVRNRLRSVPGVSEINSWGGITQQYHVVVDPRRLEKYALTLRDVAGALGGNNASFSGGFVEHRAERVTVRGLGLATGVADLEATVLTSVEGVPIRVSDVAQVRVGPMPRQGAVTRDGRGESIAGMVIMLKGENGRDVAGRVKARVEEIQKSLPAGLTLVPFYDQSEVIDRTSHTVTRNLVEGSLLVIAVLFLFLRDVRAALIVAAVIPVSMLAGFIGMRVFGVSANLMSLGAIDFGLMVDGAVVMMENFIRRRGEVEDVVAGASPGVVAGVRERLFSSAATEVARPILFGVLIIIAVYLPIFTLEGLEGKLFRPMAITVCSALLGSLVLSLTVVPVVSSFLLKLGGAHHDGPWFDRLKRRYVAHLEDAMDHRARTVSVALVVVTAAIASIPFLGTEFMPRLDEGSILVETRKLPSVSLEESVAISTRLEAIIRRFPEVRQVVTKIGRPDLATEAMGIYQGDVYVLLHPVDDWTSGRDKVTLIDDMAAALAAVPGVGVNFTQPMAMRLDEVVSGVKADVAVKIFGPDAATLERLGEQVRQRLEPVRGAADLQVEVLSGASQIEIVIDRSAAARYALNVAHVQELVETAVGGTQATQILDGARRFDVVVRLPDQLRADQAAIGALTLTAPGGEKVPLSAIAEVRQSTTPEAISHESRGPAAARKPPLARRLLHHVGRAVREPAAGDAAARRGDPAVTRHHIPAALRDVPARATGAARGAERAVRARGRHCGALAARAHAEPLGVGRVHRAVRRGGTQRRCPDRRRQRPSHRGPRPARGPARGRRHPPQAGVDDRDGRRARVRAHGAVARSGGRGAASAGDRRHRGRHHVDAADAHRAADVVRDHRNPGRTAPGVANRRTSCVCYSSRTTRPSAGSS